MILQKVSNEGLVALYRFGIQEARDTLSVRLFNIRYQLCREANEGFVQILDTWTLNEVFFRSYLFAEGAYQFGKGAFRSFLLLILTREIAKESSKVYKELTGASIFSLDEDLDGGGTYHEIVYVPSANDNEAVAYANFADLVDTLAHLPDHLPKVCGPLVLCIAEGLLITESAQTVGISASYARKVIAAFRGMLIDAKLNGNFGNGLAVAEAVIDKIEE
ncbi:MAG: hypothetical protein K6F32_00570 [Bacilli bacterium]|nr:hypothetical protein [Bacilli bacterium]